MKNLLIITALLVISFLPCKGQIINSEGGGTVDNAAVNAAIAENPGEVRKALLIPPPEVFSTAVQTLLAAHITANTAIDARSQLGLARCLGELEAGGILDDLVDGWCGRVGYNSSTSYKTIRNASPTIRGTVPNGPFGAIFTTNSGNTLTWPVTDARVSTLAVDFRYAENTADYATLGGLYNTGGATVSARSLLTNPSAGLVSAGSIYNSDAGLAAFSESIGNESDAFMVGRFNPMETMVSVSSDNAATPTIKSWVNGKLIITDSTGNYQQTSALTNLLIGAQNVSPGVYQFPLSGTCASWLLFNRVLNDVENLTVAKALRHLDPREINLVTVGDSRTAQISQSSHQTGNWPFQYWNSPQVNREMRLWNVARNGSTATAMNTGFAANAGHHAVNGTSIKSAKCIMWLGVNDLFLDTTGAQIWSSMQNMIGKARSYGMSTVVCTEPETGNYLSAPREAERLAYNALVRSNASAYEAVWDLDTLLALPRNPALYLNTVHLNNVGNGYIARNFTMGGLQNTPFALSRVGAYKSVDQTSVGSGGYTQITFDTEEFDTGSNFASSAWTAPYDCYVQVNVQLYVSAGTTGTGIIAVYKQGTAHRRVWAGQAASNSMYGGSVLVKCAAGDILTIYYYDASARTILGAANSTWVTFCIIP